MLGDPVSGDGTLDPTPRATLWVHQIPRAENSEPGSTENSDVAPIWGDLGGLLAGSSWGKNQEWCPPRVRSLELRAWGRRGPTEAQRGAEGGGSGTGWGAGTTRGSSAELMCYGCIGCGDAAELVMQPPGMRPPPRGSYSPHPRLTRVTRVRSQEASSAWNPWKQRAGLHTRGGPCRPRARCTETIERLCPPPRPRCELAPCTYLCLLKPRSVRGEINLV